MKSKKNFMKKDEFNKLYRNTIVLNKGEMFIILDFNKELGSCRGLTLKRDVSDTTVFEDEVSYSDLDFFDISEETFLADCVKYEQPISNVCIDKKNERNWNEYTIHDAVDAVCKDGLVKYFFLKLTGIYFIKSVIKQYIKI